METDFTIATDQPRKPTGNRPAARPATVRSRPLATRSALRLTLPFLIALAALLLVSIAGLDTLSAARAFVGGESSWSKAQKRAVNHLLHYTRYHDANEYQQFLQALAVTQGDRQAREEMDRAEPDYETVRAGFLLGGIHPDDIRRMYLLYRYGRHWQPVAAAIDMWREGDVQIARLQQAGETIRAQAQQQALDLEAIEAQLREVRRIDARLDRLEQRFSLALGKATRQAEQLLNTLLILGTALLAAFGVGLTRKALRDYETQQQALDASRQRYRVFFESSIDAVVLVHVDGEIIDVNPAACAMFGYSRDELVGMHRSRLIDSKAENVRQAIEARSTAGHYRGQLQYRRKDGSWFTGEISSTQFVDADGDTKYSVVIRNISRRLAQEAEIHRLNSQLEERVAERTAELEHANRELEAFCHSIAHDLTTPLRAVNGYSALLAEEYGDRLDAEAHHYLQRTREASLRMSRLIDALLDLARHARQPLHRADVDLSRMAGGLLAELQREQPERRVEIDIQPGLRLNGDAVLLHELLRQLLSNAWKFTTDADPARIGIGRDDTRQPPAYYVRDNGIGFDMAFGNKLFRAFSRLHSPGLHDGTGIGLAVVATIVDRHGGKVWAESAEGSGATFYFTLGEQPAPTAPAASHENGSASQQL